MNMRRCRETINRSNHMKKCFISCLLGAAIGVLTLGGLTGCGQEAEEIKPEKVTLELWYYWDAAATRQRLLTLIREFNETHSDIQIEAICIPDEDFKKTLALAIADGTTPDLAIVDSSDVQYYHNMESLADVTDCFDQTEYLEQALACSRVEGDRMVGLPVGVNLLCFYYNMDILEARHVNPPTNLDEFFDAAKKTTSESVYGCAFPTLQSEETTFDFLPILWSYGGNLEAIHTESGAKAFDFLRRLSKSGAMDSSMVNMTISDIINEFTKGNIAMIFTTSGQEARMRQNNPDLRFAVNALPVGENPVTIIGGEVLTVMSQNQKEPSMEFVRFMAEPERIKTYLKDMAALAPRKDILEWQMSQYPDQRKYMQYINSARTRDFTPYWPAESMAVAGMINQVVLQEDESDALAKLAEQIRIIQEEFDEGR